MSKSRCTVVADKDASFAEELAGALRARLGGRIFATASSVRGLLIAQGALWDEALLVVANQRIDDAMTGIEVLERVASLRPDARRVLLRDIFQYDPQPWLKRTALEAVIEKKAPVESIADEIARAVEAKDRGLVPAPA